jgi:hypothetical protein
MKYAIRWAQLQPQISYVDVLLDVVAELLKLCTLFFGAWTFLRVIFA